LQSANVTICSPFRDSEQGISAYFDRLSALDYPGDLLRFVWVEGDSRDNTYGILSEWATQRVSLLKCDTGIPQYGSIVHPERFKALATVFNAALDAVDLDWSTHVLFLPSDIHYGPHLLTRLLRHGRDIVAPFSWIYMGGRHQFYDIWGFTRHGRPWEPFTKAELARHVELIPMDTVGGTALIGAEVLRSGARYTTEQVDRGLCADAIRNGFTVWADPTTHVYHAPLAPTVPDLGEIVKGAAGEPERLRADILTTWGFDPGEDYPKALITFVDTMTKQVQP
jgi:hypothetical protein